MSTFVKYYAESTSTAGDKEWYFFCRRGRKYKNSIRPNRVTGSGFWKATGIDKPIHDSHINCIGLKKTLVYYRGSAGKGTKTDWMMHEFRRPSTNDNNNVHSNRSSCTVIAQSTNITDPQEAVSNEKSYSHILLQTCTLVYVFTCYD